MVKVLAVNNYPSDERFVRLLRCLEENGATVASVPWKRVRTTRFGDFDGVALSGSPDMMSEDSVLEKFGAEVAAVRDSSVPLLGICFGHQMIARSFGSDVVKARAPVLKFVKTDVVSPDGLFEGLPRPAMLLESRHEIVKSLPEGFELLAKSETTPIAAMRHRRRPIFGVQSHPERYSKENAEGKTLVGNFVNSLR